MIAAVLAVPVFLFFSKNLAAQSADFNTAKSLEIQYNILKELSNGFVDSVNLEKLVNTGIDAMLGSLDPYTEYIPEEDEQNLALLTTATYGGIGALIKKLDTTGVIISQPYAGSPAVKYGLEPGDVILKINGEDVLPLNAEECSSRMKGEPGTKVKFLVRKGRSSKTGEIEVVRERIHIPDVSYSGILQDSIGYIKIDGFTVNGSEDVKKAVVSLKEKGAKRLILDLRGNGGGLLNEAVDILSIFLPEGTLVVSQKGRKNVGADLEYRTRNEPVDTLIPLMVLVNSGSASSSEIVTGAIQDLDRGYVAGTRTYGKGLVQAIRPVGYNGTMKMTIAKYYTPSGRCVQAIDYSHRNSDGSVGYVPDSLKKAFKTRLGRTVYDGGGITPDSVITSDPYSRIAISLVMNDIINDYAIKFYKENDSIPSVKDFSLTDEQYGDFVKYAVSRNFDSRSGAQVLMEDLLKSAEQEELDDYIRAEAEALKNKLSISKEKMLELKRSEIQPLVEEEIANKYHFTAGRVEAIIKNDSQLKKAVELFAGIYVSLPGQNYCNLRIRKRFGIRNFVAVQPISRAENRFVVILLSVIFPVQFLAICYPAAFPLSPMDGVLSALYVELLIEITDNESMGLRIGHEPPECGWTYEFCLGHWIIRAVFIQ